MKRLKPFSRSRLSHWLHAVCLIILAVLASGRVHAAEPASVAVAIAKDNAPDAAAIQPIRIGMSLSLTGPLADFSNRTQNGVRMFEQDLNERGALLARPVEIVIRDDASSPETARRIYRELIDDEGINLLVSPYSSELTLAIKPLIDSRDVAMVTVASAPKIWDNPEPRIFGIYTPADRNTDGVLALAKQKGLTRLGLAYHDSEFGQAVAAGTRKGAQQHGLQMVADTSYQADAGNIGDSVSTLAAAKPEVVIVASYLDDAIAFAKAAKRQAFVPELIVFTGGPALREFGDALGHGTADGVLSTVQWTRSVRFPGSFDFGFRYRQRHRIYPSYDAAGGYAALQVLEAAVRLAQTTNATVVREQLTNMKFRSILGHYRVDNRGMQTAKATYLVQWQDSHISLVYPDDIARWPLRFPFSGWGTP